MHFGVSTHLYHDARLTREHLSDIASHGFDSVELFATRSHFDYHDADAVSALAQWLEELGLGLHGLHAPVGESYQRGRWGRLLSIASSDAAEREEAVRETNRALDVARRIPVRFMVLHLGLPAAHPASSRDRLEAARRSIEEIHALASPLNVRLALEVIPNALSTPASLVNLLEEVMELPDAGICFDFGHARLLGDIGDAIETASGYVITTHVHDNHGKEDEHLVPFDGSIEWAPVLTEIQKIGYEDTFMLEVGAGAPSGEVLARIRRACDRLERLGTVEPLEMLNMESL